MFLHTLPRCESVINRNFLADKSNAVNSIQWFDALFNVLQATHNVSNTCQHGAEYVLHKLCSVLDEKAEVLRLTYKQHG